jgi:argininosuccinate synthase
VIAVTLDVGQRRDLADVRERALALGAVRAHVLDVRDEFAREYILPALQAGALSDRGAPLGAALVWPVLARHLVRLAEMEGATAVAHGCAPDGDDQVRLEVSVRALNPGLEVLAPARRGLTPTTADPAGRQRPVRPDREAPPRIEANLWGRAVDVTDLAEPSGDPPEDLFAWTRPPAQCPETPAWVEILFERGVPAAVNGVAMPLGELIASLETIAAAHGIGRFDVVEPGLLGRTSRHLCEAPAAAVLHLAHRELQALVIPRDLGRLAHQLGRSYSDLIQQGFWFTPTREAIDAFVAAVQPRVTGTARLKLLKGAATAAGRRSPHALYDGPLAASDVLDPVDRGAVEAFIRIWGRAVEAAARTRPPGPAHVSRIAART